MADTSATAMWTAEAVSALDSSWEFWNGLPFHYLFIGHALYCTMAGPEFKDRWLVHLLLTYLWGNGGGLITAALLMQPKVASFSFFQGDFITAGWIVCWWLVNWCPGGLPAKLLNKWYIQILAKSCTMLLRAQLIISRVDLAVQLFPGVVSPPLILGTIAGCGGRLLADGIMMGWQSGPGLAELTSPGFVSRSAAFAAVAYYILAYATQLLPVQAAAGLVVTALFLHSFISDLTGSTLDFTAPVTHLLHTLTCVPRPPSRTQAVTAVIKRVAQKAAGTSSAAKSPAKTPTKAGVAKASPASKQQGATTSTSAAAVAQANAASPLVANGGTARKRQQGGKAADVCVAEEEQQSAAAEQAQKQRRSIAPDAAGAASGASGGGVTTRRRAAAAAAYA